MANQLSEFSVGDVTEVRDAEAVSGVRGADNPVSGVRTADNPVSGVRTADNPVSGDRSISAGSSGSSGAAESAIDLGSSHGDTPLGVRRDGSGSLSDQGRLDPQQGVVAFREDDFFREADDSLWSTMLRSERVIGGAQAERGPMAGQFSSWSSEFSFGEDRVPSASPIASAGGDDEATFGGVGFDPEGNVPMFDSFLQLFTGDSGRELSRQNELNAELKSGDKDSGAEPRRAASEGPPQAGGTDFLTTEQLVVMTEQMDPLQLDPSREAEQRLTQSSSPKAAAVGSDSKIITARGTEDGLVLRIDGKAEWSNILHDLDSFLGGRKRFFEGGEVSLEWLDRLPTAEQTKELEQFLKQNYGMDVSTKRRRPSQLSLARDLAREIPKEGGVREISKQEAARADAARVEALRAEILRGEGAPISSSSGSSSVGRRDPITLLDEVEQSSFSPYSRGRDESERGHRAPAVTTSSASGSGAAGFPIGTEHRAYPPTYPPPYASSSNLSAGGSFGPAHHGGPGRVSDHRYGELSSEGPMSRRSDSGRYEAGRFDAGEGLQMGIESEFGEIVGKRHASQISKLLGEDLYYDDEANAKVVFGTLRSGQRIETPFSLIVVGDVNPGADLVAGGDIIVFGSLRGTAHASAYDDDAFDRVILALQMQPMQLRIGSVISRGSDEVVKGAEVARIENRRIIVEAYSARVFLNRKLRS